MGKFNKRSLVWNYFSVTEFGKAQCNLCSKEISCPRGITSNLARHLKIVHPTLYFNTAEDISNSSCAIENISDSNNDYSDSKSLTTADSNIIELVEVVVRSEPTEENTEKQLKLVGPSALWSFFSVKEQTRAKCNLCSEEITVNNQSIDLSRHLKTAHSGVPIKTFMKLVTEKLNIDPLSLSEKNDNGSKSEDMELSLDVKDVNLTGKSQDKFKPRRKWSPIWEYYDEIESGRALCRFCSKPISYTNGATSNLSRHIRMMHSKSCENAAESPAEEIVAYENDELVACSDMDDCRDEKNSTSLENLPENSNKDSEASNNDDCNSEKIDSDEFRLHNTTQDEECSDSDDLFFCKQEFVDVEKNSDNSFETENNDSAAALDVNYLVEEIVEDLNGDIENIRVISKPYKRSQIWKYFIDEDNGKALCVFCFKYLSFTSGTTSNLSRHLRKKHPFVPLVIAGNSDKNDIADANENEMNFIKEEETVDEDLNVIDPVVIESRKRSVVWNYFDIDSIGKAVCELCSKRISYNSGGTSNLSRHLRSVHNVIFYDDHENEQLLTTDGEAAKQKNDMLSVKSSNDGLLDENELVDLPLDKNLIWKYFEDGVAKCDLCSKNISFKNGETNNLLEHLQNNHYMFTQAVSEEIDSQSNS